MQIDPDRNIQLAANTRLDKGRCGKALGIDKFHRRPPKQAAVRLLGKASQFPEVMTRCGSAFGPWDGYACDLRLLVRRHSFQFVNLFLRTKVGVIEVYYHSQAS